MGKKLDEAIEAAEGLTKHMALSFYHTKILLAEVQRLTLLSEIKRCRAITGGNNRCKHKAGSSGFCGIHGDKPDVRTSWAELKRPKEDER